MLTNNRFEGTITELIADDETIYFWIAGSEWPVTRGQTTGFSNGDLVYVAEGRFYELIIESPQETVLINRLVIGGHEGVINQEAATITFTVPENLVDNGHFRGEIDYIDADDDTLQFFVAGSQWPLMEGNTAGISTNDLVYVAGGRVYTIIIEAEARLITHLRIGSITGEVNQETATITFTIPESLVNDGHFRGAISFDADCDTLLFFVAGSEWPLTQGQVAGFSDGDLVYVAGGRVYTLRIVVR